jgi:hypothetical protein
MRWTTSHEANRLLTLRHYTGALFDQSQTPALFSQQEFLNLPPGKSHESNRMNSTTMCFLLSLREFPKPFCEVRT